MNLKLSTYKGLKMDRSVEEKTLNFYISEKSSNLTQIMDKVKSVIGFFIMSEDDLANSVLML